MFQLHSTECCVITRVSPTSVNGRCIHELWCRSDRHKPLVALKLTSERGKEKNLWGVGGGGVCVGFIRNKTVV